MHNVRQMRRALALRVLLPRPRCEGARERVCGVVGSARLGGICCRRGAGAEAAVGGEGE